MIPQSHKIDFSKCDNRSKGLDTENATYKKYGKEYPVKEYIQEFKDGTNAKDIIQKAGGLQNLPHAMEKIKDSEVVIDMNEDIYTINRKLKLGQMAQKKFNEIQKQKELLEKEIELKQPKEEKGDK